MISEQTWPVQADGECTRNAAPDGVDQEELSGRTGGGESVGGPYPNPHTGTDGDSNYGGNLGHGGQTDNDYYGPGGPPRTKQHRSPHNQGSQGAQYDDFRPRQPLPLPRLPDLRSARRPPPPGSTRIHPRHARTPPPPPP